MIPDKLKLQELFAKLRRIEQHRSADAEKEIAEVYNSMLVKLYGVVGHYYINYGTDDVLTYSDLIRNDRYARFLEEIQKTTDLHFQRSAKTIDRLVKESYEEAYNGMKKAVANSVNDMDLADRLQGLTLTRPQVIRVAVQNPVSKLTLTKTFEKNRRQIIHRVKQNITVGLMNGDRMTTVAKRIQADVNFSYRKSILISRTETHRVIETGHDDSCNDMDKIISENSEYRMVKTWENMQDNSVRQQRDANHVAMEGQTVLQDEEFDLGGGVMTRCPGQSGVARHDCNCRCMALRDVMNEEEFLEKTGRKFPKNVDNPGGSGIIGVGNDNLALEYQRYGRNKDTLINKTYIESGEYRRKFDKLTDNSNVNKTLYDCAKKALKHRSGTAYEDMYWIDGNTGKIVASETTRNIERGIAYSANTKKVINSFNKKELVTVHTHPSSMPPSAADFNSYYKAGYKESFVACHDGKIFRYTANEEINERLYDMYIASYINEHYSEYEAQLLALEEIQKNYDFYFSEVI